MRSRFDRTNWQARVVAYRPVEVATDGGDLVVVFRYGGLPELFAVRFSLTRMPEGPQTGEVCESLDDWAQEVDWVLEEELNTAWWRQPSGPWRTTGWSSFDGEARWVSAEHSPGATRAARTPA